MVDEALQVTISRYLAAVRSAGIKASRVVLFGSHARGEARDWSDIDLVVIAPDLDGDMDRRLVSKLWEIRATTDSRIEPVPCGEEEWARGDSRPIIEIARREGIVING